VNEPLQTILEEAAGLVDGPRESDYGHPRDNFADIQIGWEVIFRGGITPAKVGLAMAWVKICRELHVSKRDNLVDLAGYARTVEKVLYDEL
jgi:hypothetical protein